MPCKVHLFTGGKGGVGKTLVSLCIATHLLRIGHHVLLIDLNIFNPDLFLILKRLTDEDTFRKLNAQQFDEFREDGFIIINIANNGLLVTLDFKDKKNFQLPMGIAGFYRDYLNKIFGLSKVKNLNDNHGPQFCLVDTGFHIANMALPTRQVSAKSWLGEDTNNLSANELNIWFLWTLGALERQEERDAISETLRQLPDLGIGGFDPTTNLHHVFNAYSLDGDEPLYIIILRDVLKLHFLLPDIFNGLTTNKTVNSIPPDMLLKTIAGEVEGKKLDNKLDYPQFIADIVQQRANGRPKNVYPLYTASHLNDYITHLTGNKIMTLGELKDFLGEPYDLIQTYW